MPIGCCIDAVRSDTVYSLVFDNAADLLEMKLDDATVVAVSAEAIAKVQPMLQGFAWNGVPGLCATAGA